MQNIVIGNYQLIAAHARQFRFVPNDLHLPYGTRNEGRTLAKLPIGPASYRVTALTSLNIVVNVRPAPGYWNDRGNLICGVAVDI